MALAAGPRETVAQADTHPWATWTMGLQAMKSAQLRALATRFVTSWANPPTTAEDETLRGVLNWFAGYESCSRRHRHDRAKWRNILHSANREIRRLQVQCVELLLEKGKGRPMVIGDLCDWSFLPDETAPY